MGLHDDNDGTGTDRYLTEQEQEDIRKFSMHMFAETLPEQEKMVRVSVSLLKQEVACIEEHLEEADKHGDQCETWLNEWEDIVYHLNNMMNGVSLMFRSTLMYLLPHDATRILTEMQAMKMSVESGVPYKAVKVGGSAWAIKQERVEMPDDLSGLDGMGSDGTGTGSDGGVE